MKTRFSALGLGVLSMILVAVRFVVGRHGASYGEISAVRRGESFEHYIPAGMVLVPGGRFTGGSYGNSHESIGAENFERSVQSLYWDRATISNSQYREFLDYAEKNPNGPPGNNGGDDEGEEDEESEEEDEDVAIIKKEKVIYYMGVLVSPDESSWRVVADEQDSEFINFLDVFSKRYFTSPAYDPYPMVGIMQAAALLYCDWRSFKLNSYREAEGLPALAPYRLPTANEYSYAARGGAAMPKYSFGGPYAIDDNGDELMNFKAKRASPNTGPSESKGNGSTENGYGLYHMSGNVFSMTSTTKKSKFDGSNLYCVMGGSWVSVEACAQVGYMLFVEEDFRAPNVGFRCVMNAPQV